MVAILGGSAAWGCGATDNAATVAGVVEEALNSDPERTCSYKVYNLAQIKGFQTQDILSIVFLLSQIKPRLVVSLNGSNEVVGSQRMPAFQSALSTQLHQDFVQSISVADRGLSLPSGIVLGRTSGNSDL